MGIGIFEVSGKEVLRDMELVKIKLPYWCKEVLTISDLEMIVTFAEFIAERRKEKNKERGERDGRKIARNNPTYNKVSKTKLWPTYNNSNNNWIHKDCERWIWNPNKKWLTMKS